MKRPPHRRARGIALLVASLLVATSIPVRATPTYALPPTVRILIGGIGTSYAVIGSTATLLARTPEGQVLHRGITPVVARTDVRRLAADETPLPRVAPASEEERTNRATLLREARIADRLSSRALLRVPFEVSVLKSADDALGTPVYRADRIRGLRFEAVDGGLLSFNGKLYRGTFELADEDGSIVVINTVPTDKYLISVVGSEVPTDWHRQALAAQAVAARTYLLRHLGRYGTYDLLGDERDQAYKGFQGETDATVRAVADTTGLVATYHGVPIDAFYSANAGGRTENSEDVWVTPLPYLRGVPSPGDAVALQSSWGKTSYEWTKEYTEPALRRQLERLGVSVGRIVGIDVAERSEAGGVLRARVRGTGGSRDVLKDSTRWFFGLRSQLFSVAFREANDREVVELGTDIERERDAQRRLAELEGLGAERIATLVSARAATASAEGVVLVGFRTAAFLYNLPARIVFTGKGFGHRVGMSQWGMQGMALDGASYEAILRHYYRGVELTKVAGP